MRPLIFYGVLGLFVLTWLLLYKPCEFFTKTTKEPVISLENFFYNEWDVKGERIVLRGTEGVYEQKRFKVFNPVVQDVRGESLRANVGYYYDHRLKLHGDVRYKGKEYSFFTQRAHYDTIAQKLSVPTAFRLVGPNLEVRGNRLYYLKKIGKIEAFDIDAKAKVR